MEIIYTDEEMLRNEERYISAVRDIGRDREIKSGDDRGAPLKLVGDRMSGLGTVELSRIKDKLFSKGLILIYEDRSKQGRGRKPTFIKSNNLYSGDL